MQYLKVKNWETFQQYKDRDPKWIKLHRGLLRNYEFGTLSDNQKASLLMIWLLAAETDNKIPNDVDWIQRQGQLKSKPDIKQLITLGFLTAYNSVQECTETYLETETETETETEKEKIQKKKVFILPDWIDASVWGDYCEMRARLKKPLTERAKDLVIADLEKLKDAGDNPNDVLNQSVKNSWQGVFALKQKTNQYQNNKPTPMPSKNLVVNSPEWKIEMGIV